MEHKGSAPSCSRHRALGCPTSGIVEATVYQIGRPFQDQDPSDKLKALAKSIGSANPFTLKYLWHSCRVTPVTILETRFETTAVAMPWPLFEAGPPQDVPPHQGPKGSNSSGHGAWHGVKHPNLWKVETSYAATVSSSYSKFWQQEHLVRKVL